MNKNNKINLNNKIYKNKKIIKMTYNKFNKIIIKMINKMIKINNKYKNHQI